MKQLNLGCDLDYKEGWINLDNHGRCDVLHDLNEFPYPFSDDEFDNILASHVLEHLDDLIKVMQELHRISKPDAIIEIKAPYWNNHCSWLDVGHRHCFSYNAFSGFCKRINGYIPQLFEYESRRLVWGTTEKIWAKLICASMNWLVNICPDFVEKRFPFLITIQFLHVKLRVKK